MVTSMLWGLIQGLTEFLPVSSSAHLILVPALLGMDEPDLATTAVLHIGTLLALVWYYRRDLLSLATAPRAPHNRRLWMLLIVGTIPAAVIGLGLRSPIEIIFSEPWIVAICLVITGLVLLVAHRLTGGIRTIADGTLADALVVGMAQAIALIPGISRSGMTMTAGLAQGMSRKESARLTFLLGIPAIAGAGGIELLDVIDKGGFGWNLLAGTVVAGITGYFAVSLFIKLIGKHGLLSYAFYCIVFGLAAYFLV
ncbi:MAG: undecaprenyl-diphosphate phosphatase [Actinomycetota bacterium]